jgi:hypothetical protein
MRYVKGNSTNPLLNSVDEGIKDMLKTLSLNMMFRLNMVRTWVSIRLKEFRNFSDQVYEALDDWVVIAVEKENSAVNQVI